MSASLSNEQRHARIWAVIKRIPRGRVATYGQVAAEAGFVKQPRLTAQALRHAPDTLELPWYRVINAQGKLSFPLDSEAYRRARSQLEAEGVIFVRGKVDFEIYRWRPRSAAPVLD
ncbi:MGMT family protein [Solimonas terrae]|uniref:Methyltransferase n=1 Tax=Solimonas terrae TaxID=1396819 RepID=A0A6M2BVT6_9GAMM|nr:MGMT family protein [Solimonas terrae]NGY06470.1 methyltransferase [Solimonas terrae]